MFHNIRIKNNFYSNLFEKEKISNVFERLSIKDGNTCIYKSAVKSKPKPNVNAQTLVPDYLEFELIEPLKAKKVFQKKGYAINTASISDIETYLKETSGTNFKKNVVRSLKRLEHCFNITYKMFYGEIDQDEYAFLMDNLVAMIRKRFQERKGRNRVIENWDYYKKISFNLINKKKASLFVIYSGENPIEISLNFHAGSVMYSAISSYSLDYHKFSMGNIDIYKQLEWCLENKITLFDMGYGDFDYKMKWSNWAYDFNTLVISNKNNLVAKVYAYYLRNKYNLINYLISKNVSDMVRGFISKLKSNNPVGTDGYENYTMDEIQQFSNNKANKVESLNGAYSFLQKPLNEFLYAHSEHIDNVKIYKLNSENKTFVFESPKNSNKLVFQN
ncbi:GNAT family N-acetyltransferase [Flavobacteriaceae bacterium SZ-1-7]|uniref:GNAT family N-acetyltransferase n=1 Tax=Tamlana sedimenti TaxID=3134126 RepID=UPI003128E81A